jgi:UDP-N-acetylglucosamine acyltransferase
MLGGLGSVTKDIPPFVIQQGYNCVSGLNLVGLRRAGLSTEAIAALRVAFRILYKEGRTQSGALEMITADLGSISEVAEFVGFIKASKIGISPARDPGRTRRSE